MGRIEAALYLHVPFCRKKCPYCDFYSEPQVPSPTLVRRYLEAVKKELLLRLREAAPYRYVTFYAGGGTPSLLPPAFYEELLSFLKEKLDFAPQERTLEANPEGLTYELLAAYRRVFNRLSLGIQSLSAQGLRTLGRSHNVRQAEEAVLNAQKAGFQNLSLDLIFGWPGQRPEDLAKELAELVALGPAHVSCYEFTVEPGTPFYTWVTSGRIRLLPEEEVVSMYEMIPAYLARQGFERYEISNYARPGLYCQHNLFYWEAKPYLGLGPAAASYLGEKRVKNVAHLKTYLESLEAGALPVQEEERLSREARFREAVILGLRLVQGLDPASLKERFGYDLFAYYGETLERLMTNGLVEQVGSRLRLTKQGLLLANVVFRALV